MLNWTTIVSWGLYLPIVRSYIRDYITLCPCTGYRERAGATAVPVVWLELIKTNSAQLSVTRQLPESKCKGLCGKLQFLLAGNHFQFQVEHTLADLTINYQLGDWRHFVAGDLII